MAMSRSRAGTPFTRRPSISRSPAVTFSSPTTIRMVEDFPQPDGPSRQRNSPSRQVSDRSRTAWTLPYVFQMCRSSTVAIVQLLHGPEGKAANEMALEQHRENEDRDDAHRGGRHEGAPANAHRCREPGDGDGQGPHMVGREDRGEQELVPGEDGRKDG